MTAALLVALLLADVALLLALVAGAVLAVVRAPPAQERDP